MTTNTYDADDLAGLAAREDAASYTPEPATAEIPAVDPVDELAARWREQASEPARVLPALALSPRLRHITYPDGRYLVVLDRVPEGEAADLAVTLRERYERAAVVVSHLTIEIPQLEEPDLSLLDDDGPPADGPLIRQLRQSFTRQAAEAEAWQEQGAAAVERVGELEAEVARLRGVLTEVYDVALDNRDVPACSRIADVVTARAGRAA